MNSESRAAGMSEPCKRFQAWHGYLLVALTALAARGLYLAEMSRAPFFNLRIGDGRVYHEWARDIADGAWVGDQVFYQAPLYPYLLALVYSIFGDSMFVVRVIQILMGTGACVFLAMAGRSFFGLGHGVAAGMILALYAPAIFLEGFVQKTALAMLLTTALLAALGAVSTRPGRWRWTGVGLLLGLLVLTRENAMILLPIVLLWARLMPGVGKREGRISIAVCIAGTALILLPVGIRNVMVGGEFHITTSQAGSNFFIGNGRMAHGTYRSVYSGRGDAMHERHDATRRAEHELGRRLTPREVSRFWWDQSWSYIKAEPRIWVRLLLHKTRLTFNKAEMPDTIDQATYSEWSRTLKATSFAMHMGILCPIAVFGIAMTGGSWRKLWVLYALAAAYAISLIAFYVVARYRLLITPVLMLFAGAGLVELFRQLGHGGYRRRLCAGIALAAGVLLLTNTHLRIAQSKHHRLVTYHNIAVMLAGVEGRENDAVEFFRRTLEIGPGYQVAHASLALLLCDLGRPGEALEHARTAVELTPRYIYAHLSLATCYEGLERIAEAETQLEHALELDPGRANTHNALGELLLEQDRATEAAAHFVRALDIRPDFEAARTNLLRATTTR